MHEPIFRSSLNLERPKHILDKSVVVDEVPYWLESSSETEGEGESWSTAESSTWGSTTGASETFSQGYSRDEEELGYSEIGGSSATESYGGGSTSTVGGSRMSSRTTGRAQTLKPVRVTLPTTVYSLEEELHLAIVKLRELPNRAAILKRRGHFPVRFRPVTIDRAVASSALTQGFIASSREASPYVSDSFAADGEIEARQKQLVSAKVAPEEPPAEVQFWTE